MACAALAVGGPVRFAARPWAGKSSAPFRDAYAARARHRQRALRLAARAAVVLRLSAGIVRAAELVAAAACGPARAVCTPGVGAHVVPGAGAARAPAHLEGA